MKSFNWSSVILSSTISFMCLLLPILSPVNPCLHVLSLPFMLLFVRPLTGHASGGLTVYYLATIRTSSNMCTGLPFLVSLLINLCTSSFVSPPGPYRGSIFLSFFCLGIVMEPQVRRWYVYRVYQCVCFSSVFNAVDSVNPVDIAHQRLSLRC